MTLDLLWQPIDTVPRTGESVLAFVPHRSPPVVVGHWFTWADESRAYLTPCEDLANEDLGATHWMPMPVLPVVEPKAAPEPITVDGEWVNAGTGVRYVTKNGVWTVVEEFA